MAALDVARAAADAQHLKSGSAERLAERKGISPSEVALARAAEAEAKARVAMARAEIAEAESEVRISRAGLDSTHAIAEATKIRSPYDGVVTRRGCHVGELVGSPSAGKVAPLFTVVRTDIMRVEVPVPDRDSPYVDPGDPAKIRIDALGPRTVYEGRISSHGL